MASFSAMDSIEKLGEELECSICMQRFQNARFLECLHTFCELCLECCARRETGNIITCPICRSVTLLPERGVPGLKSNPIVNRVSEALDRLDIHESKLTKTVILCDACGSPETVSNWYCRECSNFLCDLCKDAHARMKNQFRDHLIVCVEDVRNHRLSIDWCNDGQASKTPECDHHPGEPLKFYCHLCKTRICRDCIVLDHRDHECTTLHKVVKSMKSEIEGLAVQCNQKQLMGQSAVKTLDLRRLESNRSIETLRSAVRNAATIAAEKVKRQEDNLLHKLDAVQNKAEGLFEDSKVNYRRINEGIANATKVVTKMLVNGDDDDMAALHGNLVKTMKDMLVKEVDTKRDLSDAVNQIRFESGFDGDEEPLAIKVGRLLIPCIWLNTQNIDVMSSAVAIFLSDGSLVTCRLSGGFNIIDSKPDQPSEKIKYNQPITNMTVLNNDTICVLDRKNVIRSIPKGKSTPSKQLGRYSGKGTCITTCSNKDQQDIVVLQPRKAPYFSRLIWLSTDGEELGTCELEFTPNDIILSSTLMAFISADNKSVIITDQSGTELDTITNEGRVYTAISCDPASEFLFLASMPDEQSADKSGSNRVTIAKHTFGNGRHVEDIVQSLEVKDETGVMSLANYKEEKVAISCGEVVHVFESTRSSECKMLSCLL